MGIRQKKPLLSLKVLLVTGSTQQITGRKCGIFLIMEQTELMARNKSLLCRVQDIISLRPGVRKVELDCRMASFPGSVSMVGIL